MYSGAIVSADMPLVRLGVETCLLLVALGSQEYGSVLMDGFKQLANLH